MFETSNSECKSPLDRQKDGLKINGVWVLLFSCARSSIEPRSFYANWRSFQSGHEAICHIDLQISLFYCHCHCLNTYFLWNLSQFTSAVRNWKHDTKFCLDFQAIKYELKFRAQFDKILLFLLHSHFRNTSRCNYMYLDKINRKYRRNNTGIGFKQKWQECLWSQADRKRF